MPDDNITSQPTDQSSAPIQTTPVDVTATPDPSQATAPMPSAIPMNDPSMANETAGVPDAAGADSGSGIYAEVAGKISEAQNVLVALSSDPSVDEMAAAIGLSLYLDRLGKRATAIYSGTTPNALEFLKPEETFDSTAYTLQDFVIALNKEKADHLRYKLDGDYVKVYITPYRTRITEEDLEFSYGDFNVDLVLALDVANGIDLDSALREHGRIMHDAVIINITTGNPGKFGEIEWSDKSASSVSEMIAKLLYSVRSKVEIEKDDATAFLTGIVAATNRFSNAKTTPETMKIASKLMESGANQQLISKNITPDVDNEMYSLLSLPTQGEMPRDDDPTKLDIEHGNEEGVDETKEVDTNVTEKESTLLDDLKAAEASLAQAGAETTPEITDQPVKIEDGNFSEPATETPKLTSEPSIVPSPTIKTPEPEMSEPVLPPVVDDESEKLSSEPASEPSETDTEEKPLDEPKDDDQPSEKVVQPSADFGSTVPDVAQADKYGKMLEDALSDAEATVAPSSDSETSIFSSNPAATSAPTVATNPEINGVPSINYMPAPGEEVLPPPPTPPIDMDSAMPSESIPTAPITPIQPAMPVEPPTPAPLGSQPAMQDQVYRPQAADPGAFKIPGT